MSIGQGDVERFDERASTWDDAPHRVERARVAARLIGERVTIGPETRLLDFGAGTGLLAQHLAAHVGAIMLVEPSEGMREVLAAKVAADVLPGAEVLDLDLAASDPPSDLACDLVASVMAFHHVADIPGALHRLRSLLPVGGHLCIVDLEEEDGSYHSPDFSGHRGIARGMLASALQAAGFGAPTFDHAYTIEKRGREYPLFLAVGRAI